MEKIALLSVYNKDGIVEFARELIAFGWSIISSGGTARVLREAGIAVTDVAEITGREAVLGHRVVTLAPEIHGGLMATEDMRQELEELGWPWIDLVCVDFYPLEDAIAYEDATAQSVIEATDIGGPTIVRSAAKGRRIVVVDPADRQRVIHWLKDEQPNRQEFRDALAAKAEGIIAQYCLSSARFHSGGTIDGVIGTQVAECKYGENAWQQPAGLFDSGTEDSLALSRFELVQGNTPGYNTWCELDRMLQTMTHVAAAMMKDTGSIPYIALGVKHGNPCGAALVDARKEFGSELALSKMLRGDPLAIFGGHVMVNFPMSAEHAKVLIDLTTESGGRRIIDSVTAPFFSDRAKEKLKRKGGRCPLLANRVLRLGTDMVDRVARIRNVRGGFLRQPNYTFVPDFCNDPDLEEIGRSFTAKQHRDALLAWGVGSTSDSNTITLVKDGMLIGNGVGQQDRVGAAKLALERAQRSGHDTDGAVAYSDSFFPFPDGPQTLIDAGINVIFTTHGSVNDKAIRDVCLNAGVTLLMLPDRKARGFFGH